MKLLFLTFFLFTQTALANTLTCRTLGPAPKEMRTFTVNEIAGHHQGFSSIAGLDARQYEASEKKGNNTIITLHNGCDNLFELTFTTKTLSGILARKVLALKGRVKYRFPGTEESELAGKSFINCEINL